MKSTLPFLIFLIILINGKYGEGANCDSTEKDQCKLIVTYAQQNNFNDTELCWSLKSAVGCLTTLAPSCQGDLDWKSTVIDYNSQIKRLNCSDASPPVCDRGKMSKCLNLAIDADGEVEADRQCNKYQTASDCSNKLSSTCRFTPLWITVESYVSDKVSRCAEGYCNGTLIDDCMKAVKDSTGKSYQQICQDTAIAVTCLQPLEPGCHNNSDWNNRFEQLNSAVAECRLTAGCFLDDVRQCLTKDLGISLDGSTVPGSICQNYPSFKLCWDKHATLCAQNPLFQYLQAIANRYHECQINCNTTVVIEVGNCYMGLGWTRRIKGFSNLTELQDICHNLTQFKSCYLPKRGACFYNEYIKDIIPDMDNVVNITNRLCQHDIQQVDEDCFNNSDVKNQTTICNAEIFKPLPDCGDIKSPNFNCTKSAVSDLCSANNATVAAKINEELFKLFIFDHDNSPCTTTHGPTSSHITSASGSKSSHINTGSKSSGIPVSTSAYRTTPGNDGNSLNKNLPALYFVLLIYLFVIMRFKTL